MVTAINSILITAIALAAAVLIIFLAVALKKFRNQSKYLYNPVREITITPEDIGLQYEQVWLKTPDGLSIEGWLISSGARIDQENQTILFLHGKGGNLSTKLELANMLITKTGADLFMIDYRGFGRSEGEPTEEGTYMDSETAWDFLTEQKEISPENIIIHGRSLGGPIAARLAAKQNPSALILDSTFRNVKEIAVLVYPYLSSFVRFFKYDYNTLEYIKDVKCPTLVIHSKNDRYVPYSHGQSIYSAIKGRKDFLEINGGHGRSYIESEIKYTDGIKNFIKKSR